MVSYLNVVREFNSTYLRNIFEVKFERFLRRIRVLVRPIDVQRVFSVGQTWNLLWRDCTLVKRQQTDIKLITT